VEQQTLTLATANQRLSTQMKLRIAAFGKEAYTISEQWYKLARRIPSQCNSIYCQLP
jgi:hypothetical protein